MCMIVKNEEKFLGKCLESVKGLADEIIVVDTGSTDRTIEIAKKAGAKVISYEWNDDTAAARNAGLKEAKGDWILILDADEIIGKESFEPIRKLTGMDFDAFYLVQMNYTNNTKDINFVPARKTPYSMDFSGFFPVEIIRLFRNSKGIEFTSIVHERLNESIKRLGLKTARTDIPIHHYQSLKGEAEMKRKQLAFLRLFEKKIKEFPDDEKMYHDMGIIYYNYENDEKKAVECFEKAMKLNPKYLAPMFSLAAIYSRKKDNAKAKGMYEKILAIDQKHAQTHYNLGNILAEEKNYRDAIMHYTESAKLKPNPLVFNNLGNIFVILARWDAALLSYRTAIQLNHPRKEQLQKKADEIERMIEKKKEKN